MDLTKKLTQFCIGGSAYVGLELLYRRRSHISMFGAGGLCYLLLGQMDRLSLPQGVRAGCSAGVITAVELLTGLMVNRDYQVWDYRDQPGNLMGQICPRFTALWVPVGMAAMGMYRLVDGGLDKLMPSPIPTFGQKREIPRRI